MWNPLYMLRTCIGRKMLCQLICILLVVLVILFGTYVMPQVYAEMELANEVPFHIGDYALDAIGGLIGLALLYLCCFFCCPSCRSTKAEEDSDDEEDEDDDDAMV